MDTAVIHGVFACLGALFPTALLAYSVGRETNPKIGSVVAGLCGMYLTWHFELAEGGTGVFGAYLGVVTIVLAESHSFLQEAKDHSQGKYPRHPTLLEHFPGIVVGVVGVVLVKALGDRRSDLVSNRLVEILRYAAVKWLLIAGGTLVVVSLLALLVALFTSEEIYKKAQRLHLALLHDYFPNSRPFAAAEKLDGLTLERLKADPRVEEARALYLRALEMDSGRNSWQPQLNRGTVHSELMLLSRQTEEFSDALLNGQRALDALNSLANDRPGERKVLSALSLAYFRIGETNHVSGNRGAAMEAYEHGLAIDQRLGDTEGQEMYRRLIAKLG